MLKKRQVLRAILHLELLATVIVFITILLAFFRPQTPTPVFLSFLSFLLVQVFASREFAELVTITRRLKLLTGGPYFPVVSLKVPWRIPAGAAVRNAFFPLLIFFDIAWLSHAYLYPSPAGTYQQFLQQLAIGPISGTAFVVFTILLWIFYAYLFLVGAIYTSELISLQTPVPPAVADPEGTTTKEIWIRVKTADGEELYLQGNHLHNPGKQPLILWPGFYQNGFVYDLCPEASLARYLWKQGFDIWIIHPRGTALSDGRWRKTSLDDFASDDIPTVINRVFSLTGKKPVFVGHSQGGISAIISLTGVNKTINNEVTLSGKAVDDRQKLLRGLVVMGSFPDFSFSKPSWLPTFVKEGLCLTLGKKKMKLLSSERLLHFTSRFVYLGTPFSFPLREALLQNKKIRWALFPIPLLLNFIALRKLWEFLYHTPNVSSRHRKILFCKTMDGTFSQIVGQFHAAVANNAMCSVSREVNYSENYHRLTVPVSVVAMELDTLADAQMMKQKMFNALGSKEKFFTLWKGVGHEDHFTHPAFFPQVLEAIRFVC